MPIEFRCRKCQKRLRVSDESAGKSAKCPECGMVQEIPLPEPPASPPPDGPPRLGPEPPAAPRQSPADPGSPFSASPDSVTMRDSGNPYQSPSGPATTSALPGAPALRQAIVPTPVVFGEVFQHTWELFKINLAPALVATLLFQFIQFPLYFVFMIGMVGAGAVGSPILAVAGPLMFVLVIVLVNIWLMPGFIQILLQCGRCEKVELMNLFRGGPHFVRYFGATCLFMLAIFGLLIVVFSVGGIAVAVGAQFLPPAAVFTLPLLVFGGYLLVFVGMIALGISLGWYHFLIVDQDLGVMDSFRLSWQIMRGNKTTVFFTVLVTQLLGMVLNICTCGVGGILLGPYFGILMVTIYLMASGQPLGTMPDYRPSDPGTSSPFSPAPSPVAPAE